MKPNWKTTLTSLIGALAMVLAHFNVILSPDMQMAIVSITVIVLGFFAHDAGNPAPVDPNSDGSHP